MGSWLKLWAHTIVVLLIISITVVSTSAQESIPSWIKNNAGWWAGGQIDDTTFIDGLEYLISKDILIVDAVQTSKYSKGIPEWVKQNANWWSSNEVTDTEFLNSIKYLVENGIITIEKIPNDFHDIQNWQIYDHSKQSLGNYLEGYAGTIAEGDFVYFAAFDSSRGRHGEVLRYDTTKDFESAEAWSTFDAGAHGVGNDPDSFTGIISDGKFLYFAPYHNGDKFSGEVLRYDTTKDFDSVEAWNAFDPSNNGVGYDATGYWGGTFDGRYVYLSPDWNTNEAGNPEAHGEVLRYDTTKDFESAEAWSTFDASKNGVGYDPREYLNAVFDGKFIYFSPLANKGAHGEVLRYDTTKDFESAEAWSTFDASKNGVGNEPRGYDGIIFDGKFVYFSPRANDSGPHGEVLRYDTSKDFESVEAWSTFDPSNNGVGSNPIGFGDGIFDGKFVYFSPLFNGENHHAEVLRYDTTKEFESVEAWSTFDPSKNGVGIRPMGFQDISFDGQFLYFAPLSSDWGFSHEVLRYDTTKNFESGESWSTFNPMHNAPYSPVGYSGGVYEKNYVYFSQLNNGITTGGEVLRYDTTKDFDSVEAWSTFDAGNFGIGVDPDGYSGIISDGKFLYFTPFQNSDKFSGEVLRYDTTKEFDSAEAWSTFDPSKNGVGIRPTGYLSGAFDGRYVYLSPSVNIDDAGNLVAHGEVLRYDTSKDFESVEAWSTFDPSKNGLGIDVIAYSGIIFDGDSIYFVPYLQQISHGNVLKFQAWK